MAKTQNKSKKQPKQTTTDVLEDSFLVGSTAARPFVKAGTPPAYVTANVSVGVIPLPGPNNKVAFALTLRIEARYDPTDERAAFFVEATYQTNFMLSTKPDTIEFGKWSLNFASKNVVPLVWPYWRELVQSMSMKMGLPALKVPLVVPIGVKFVATKPPTSDT
jgi:preprotein translocase subunit SecB